LLTQFFSALLAQAVNLDVLAVHRAPLPGVAGRVEAVEIRPVKILDFSAPGADQMMVLIQVDIVAGLVVDKLKPLDKAVFFESADSSVHRVQRYRFQPAAYPDIDIVGGRVAGVAGQLAENLEPLLGDFQLSVPAGAFEPLDKLRRRYLYISGHDILIV